MRNMNLENKKLDIVFNTLNFDFVPMEEVFYDANSGSLRISAELEDESRVTIFFSRVNEFHLEKNDDYDMNVFCPDDFFKVTLYKLSDGDIYFFPTDENVWKICSNNHPELL